MAPEDTLLHAQFLHLAQDHRGLLDVGPEHDGIHSGILYDLQLMTKIDISFQKLLLDDDRMPQAAGGVAKLHDAKAAIAIVDPQQCNPLQAEFAVDMPREGVALHSIILKIGEVPGNDGFWDG